MEELFRFLATYEVGIYIVIGVIVLIYLKRLIDAGIALKKAQFGLEREVAQKSLRLSVTIIVLVALVGVSNFILISVASIKFPGISRIATPTIDLNVTPEPDQAEVTQTPEFLKQTQTAIALTGCIPGELEWVQPISGDEVSGSVELKGTVNIPNFGFYKYEYQMQGEDLWTPISAGNRPVIEDSFGGRWNTDQLEPGNYSLRLVALDNQNNLLKPCVIDVKVIPQ
ncbi:hypothetical protein [Pelolinea submarina]|uniref:Uncharacterized protein n=1 Tax=Pelolinea submarina TaxID=913107 RepID=A0A347ZSA6_9CHLR|nr:hypothetical protein [Pelolinea submarina]REG11248.1 hypothetical protein DFR64_1126 [Pelolinea submarina]BBB48187.1 hypothetical protein Pelsub_P1415 [Pelolinea submarina]